MMLEELQRRNYSEDTTRFYIRTVEDFSRRFNRPPDRLGPRHIREYQAELFQKRKLSPGTVAHHLSALRFFYAKTLKKGWSIAETPYPKRAFHLPSILSQEEVTRLIDAALTPYHRILLMTLYATGARNAELTHLKASDIDSKRMVIHIQGGKGRVDRDVMLSPKLLEELREHWRRLPRKSSEWLFPGNRWHSSGQPIDTLFCHASPRSRHGSAHHSDPVRSSRFERDLHLPPSLRTSPPCDFQSSGLVEVKRRTTERIDEPAAPRGGRSHPQRGSCLH
jgi:site-specific recombinase XerD